MSKTILITGATGKQGGSVITALLNANADVEILAVTRDASSGGAQKVKAKSSNIKLVEGNLDDAEKIFENARGVTSQPIWGVYSVQVNLFTDTICPSGFNVILGSGTWWIGQRGRRETRQ